LTATYLCATLLASLARGGLRKAGEKAVGDKNIGILTGRAAGGGASKRTGSNASGLPATKCLEEQLVATRNWYWWCGSRRLSCISSGKSLEQTILFHNVGCTAHDRGTASASVRGE